jgi:hypothetical protein
MKNFNGQPFFSVVFRSAGQSENQDLGARPREYCLLYSPPYVQTQPCHPYMSDHGHPHTKLKFHSASLPTSSESTGARVEDGEEEEHGDEEV